MWVVENGKPVFTGKKEKRVKHIEGVIMDINELKKLEKALLESQRLSTMGEMAASVAHDFNY